MKNDMTRRIRGIAGSLIVAGGTMVIAASGAQAEPAGKATLYKDPSCGCCTGYAEHLQRNGYDVEVQNVGNIEVTKKMAGVPDELASCHTMVIGGYVVEGHVPLDVVAQLLDEKPKVRGIALPGMPMGSPGMNGEKTEPFEIRAFGRDGSHDVYAVR